ncbi:MAG TPA: hypothetical protein VI112_12160 [Bacteroidia bacterium]|jgi:hypothetical protein
MKISGCFISLLLTLQFSYAQHSPYYYEKKSDDYGITDEVHAQFVNRVRFIQEESDGVNAVIKKNDKGECLEFRPIGQIEYTAYFEHSLQYYYDQFLKDPSQKKEDWDYHKLLDDKYKTPVGWLVFIIKVDGNEAGSWILQMNEDEMTQHTFVNCDNIWRGPTDNYEKLDDIYKDVIGYFSLMTYLRDMVKPGSYKVEVEVYPGKMNCKSENDRSGKPICKGEFRLTFNSEEAKALAGAGGPRKPSHDEVYYLEYGAQLRRMR